MTNGMEQRMSESLQHDSNVHARSCPERALALIDPDGLGTLTAVADWVVIPRDGTSRGEVHTRPRLLDGSGSELCTICHARLNQRDGHGRVKPRRPYGDGHAHDSCVRRLQRQEKRNSEMANLDSQDERPIKRQRRMDVSQHDARLRAAAALGAITRTLKPYSELHRSQRTERNAILSDVLQGLCMTLEDLTVRLVLSPDKCAAFDNHQLKALREVFPIPSHTSINKERRRWASKYGCGTEAFTTNVRVAYITDPMSILNHFQAVTALNTSQWRCVVGIDKGGNLTKIGITYPTDRFERNQVIWDFCPFILTTGNDDWDGLNIMHSNQFHFTSLSSGYSDYTQVFQKILDDRGGLFGGDWNSSNAVLGLSTASASHPCFACTVHRSNLLTIAPPRSENQVALNTLYVVDHPSTVPNMNLSMVRIPHLTVPYSNIVPTPLHVFLGLCNRVVEFFKKYSSEEFISSLKAEARGHAQVTGAATVYDLNGPQLSRWIRRNFVDRVVQECLSKYDRLPVSGMMRIRKAGEWMTNLHDYLLHSRTWSADEVDKFRQLKDSMWADWTKITGDAPTPKLHMLHHCVEFVANHGVLGRYSEAQLESCHADANRAFERVHMNVIHQPPLRLKRTLVTVVTKQLSPRRSKRKHCHRTS